MAKKKIFVNDGAPAYMNQYSALMILLLAFFIVLVALSSFQESGFQAGIGEIRNAFGISGGYGIFDFAVHGQGRSNPPNPTVDDRGQPGVDQTLLTGEGGVGDTDLETKQKDNSGYICFVLNPKFKEGSDGLTDPIREEVKKLALGISLFEYKIQIRSFSMEMPDAEANKRLAILRAAQIMRYMESAGVPYEKMECAGYSDKRYFQSSNASITKSGEIQKLTGAELETEQKKNLEESKQGTYFYIFTTDLQTK